MKDPQFAKFVVFTSSLVPLALLGWDASRDSLGTNPVEFAIRTTGMLTLVFLFLSLAVTPVRLFTGWNWLSHFRRMLGLYAFFYGLVHLSTYFVFDRSMSLRSTIDDTFKRPFIFAGMTGFLMMVPLAATSTNGMVKRMGAVKWKRLHRLAYVAAIAGLVHYWWIVKVISFQEKAFAGVLGILLGYRLVGKYLPTLRRSKRAVPSQQASV